MRDHLAAGHHIPGIFTLNPSMSIGETIEELALIWVSAIRKVVLSGGSVITLANNSNTPGIETAVFLSWLADSNSAISKSLQ